MRSRKNHNPNAARQIVLSGHGRRSKHREKHCANEKPSQNNNQSQSNNHSLNGAKKNKLRVLPKDEAWKDVRERFFPEFLQFFLLAL